VLSVLTWKWGEAYGPEYVNRLRNMLERHLHVEHRLVCITDAPEGIDPRVPYIRMPAEWFEDRGRSALHCFKRLLMFNRDFAQAIGPRLLHMDLDVVLVGDITPLVDRTDPVVIYQMPQRNVTHVPPFNPSVLLMDAGALHGVWEQYGNQPAKAFEAKFIGCLPGSDMAIISTWLKDRGVATYGAKDGVYPYYGPIAKTGALPKDARAVLFYGTKNPADAKWPWVTENWK
jgi:hypothetical protein